MRKNDASFMWIQGGKVLTHFQRNKARWNQYVERAATEGKNI